MKKILILFVIITVLLTMQVLPAKAELSNGMAATEVYGQSIAGVPTFTQGSTNNGGSVSASGMNEPRG